MIRRGRLKSTGASTGHRGIWQFPPKESVYRTGGGLDSGRLVLLGRCQFGQSHPCEQEWGKKDVHDSGGGKADILQGQSEPGVPGGQIPEDKVKGNQSGQHKQASQKKTQDFGCDGGASGIEAHESHLQGPGNDDAGQESSVAQDCRGLASGATAIEGKCEQPESKARGHGDSNLELRGEPAPPFAEQIEVLR